MIDEPADAARLRRVRGGDVLHGYPSPPCLVLDVGLQLAEGPQGDPAPFRRFFPIPSLVGVSDPFEPLEHDRLVVRSCLLHNQCGDSMQGLTHAFFLSSRNCELLPETPVIGMSLVEPGTPNPVEGVEASDLGEVVCRPIATDDDLLVEVVADPSRRLRHWSLLRE